MKYVIFDIDGVLADSSHRLHHIMKDPKDWDSFFNPALMMIDYPILPAFAVLHALQAEEDIRIIFFTGRPERTRDVTTRWLVQHMESADIGYSEELRMRANGDYRNDDIVKEQWLREIGPENVLCAFEDRNRIVAMYRRHGVICYQAAFGDF